MQYYVQKLVIGAVLLAGILLAFYFGINVGDGDYKGILLFVGLSVVLAIFGLVKDNTWVFIPIAIVIKWKFNFLPGRFTVFEFVILAGTAFYLTSYLSFQKRMLRVGPVWIWLPFAILFSIILYHWYMGGIGMNLLGGETFGARRNLNFIFALLAFSLILTLRKGDMMSLERLPLIYCLSTLVAIVPLYITTFFPSTSGVIYQLFGMYDASAYEQMVSGFSGDEAAKRQGELATFTTALQVLLITRYKITSWWHPGRLWVLLLSVLCLYGTLASGFRGALFVYVVVNSVAAFMTLRWKVLPFLLIGLVGMVFLTMGQNRVFNLPVMVQRSLSFLPGEWDDSAMKSALASNAFRESMKTIYLEEFAMRSPWIGTGFQFDPSQFMNRGIQVGLNAADESREFITRKDYHIGWISVYDTTGIVGSVAFCLLCLAFLLKAGVFMFKARQAKPVQIWACAYVIAEVITYFTTFGALQNTIVQLACYGGVLYVALDDLPEHERQKLENPEIGKS
ncbi:MAG: hypothetical protein SFU85_13275 [Candidatus Methylacidiphilales bacterium]|nr:hypothetical protein [Candidatus Methylacidiphilales bacterium]